jgi:hypothetical protein
LTALSQLLSYLYLQHSAVCTTKSLHCPAPRGTASVNPPQQPPPQSCALRRILRVCNSTIDVARLQSGCEDRHLNIFALEGLARASTGGCRGFGWPIQIESLDSSYLPLSVSWNTSCNSQDFVSKALTATPQSIINQMKFLSVFFIIALIGAAAGQTYIPMADVIAQRCNFSVACIQQSPVPIEGQVFSSYFNPNLTEWTHYSTEDALGAMLKCPMGFYPDPVYSYYCVQYTKKVAKSICLARNTLQCTDITGNIALSPIGCCPKPS